MLVGDGSAPLGGKGGDETHGDRKVVRDLGTPVLDWGAGADGAVARRFSFGLTSRDSPRCFSDHIRPRVGEGKLTEIKVVKDTVQLGGGKILVLVESIPGVGGLLKLLEAVVIEEVVENSTSSISSA
jgi:hypothetical protein